MSDSDLAELYGVKTFVLNQAVRRNIERFPDDFMFQLTREEYKSLRSQFVILESGRGQHKKYLPRVFTEQGVAMLSSVLRSRRAIQVNIQIIRTFTQLRELLATNKELKEKIESNKLAILAYTPAQIEKILLEGGGILESVIKEINPKRIVFDSLSAFSMLHREGLAQRAACMSLFQNIKRWDCTALFVAEHETDPDEHDPLTEEFEVDSVILLYSIRKGNIRTRALEVLKMRSTNYPLQIFPMTIDNEGLSVHRDKLVF